jgi:hypothetical protein
MSNELRITTLPPTLHNLSLLHRRELIQVIHDILGETECALLIVPNILQRRKLTINETLNVLEDVYAREMRDLGVWVVCY